MMFADLCGGPGGFAEYVLTQFQGWKTRGFGLTLRGADDYQLAKFNTHAPTQTFDVYYGEEGCDSGDITHPRNLRGFCEYIQRKTDLQGLDLVMADGAVPVREERHQGNEEAQERLNRQLTVCQIAVAIGCLRPGGTLVLKLFDTFTPFVINVLKPLAKECFARVGLAKPRQSRPANSERYLVCLDYLASADTSEKLFETLAAQSHGLRGRDLRRGGTNGRRPRITPPEWLPDTFERFVYEHNNKHVRMQCAYLDAIHHHLRARDIGPQMCPSLMSFCDTTPGANTSAADVRADADAEESESNSRRITGDALSTRCIKQWLLTDGAQAPRPLVPGVSIDDESFGHHWCKCHETFDWLRHPVFCDMMACMRKMDVAPVANRTDVDLRQMIRDRCRGASDDDIECFLIPVRSSSRMDVAQWCLLGVTCRDEIMWLPTREEQTALTLGEWMTKSPPHTTAATATYFGLPPDSFLLGVWVDQVLYALDVWSVPGHHAWEAMRAQPQAVRWRLLHTLCAGHERVVFRPPIALSRLKTADLPETFHLVYQVGPDLGVCRNLHCP